MCHARLRPEPMRCTFVRPAGFGVVLALAHGPIGHGPICARPVVNKKKKAKEKKRQNINSVCFGSYPVSYHQSNHHDSKSRKSRGRQHSKESCMGNSMATNSICNDANDAADLPEGRENTIATLISLGSTSGTDVPVVTDQQGEECDNFIVPDATPIEFAQFAARCIEESYVASSPHFPGKRTWRSASTPQGKLSLDLIPLQIHLMRTAPTVTQMSTRQICLAKKHDTASGSLSELTTLSESSSTGDYGMSTGMLCDHLMAALEWNFFLTLNDSSSEYSGSPLAFASPRPTPTPTMVGLSPSS